MKLRNTTSHPADLLTTASAKADDRKLGCVIVRTTYRVAGGELVQTPDEPWPISPSPVDTPLGQMPGDMPFYLGGVDVLIGGRVRQPGGVARPRLDVVVEVGPSFRRAVTVFGDRRWIDAPSGLAPSEPQPFVSMPLGYDRAFGGRAPTEYDLTLPFAANPEGRGFYLDAKGARGAPLPNLEHPERPIRTIHDQPDPVGLGYYPVDGALRAASSTRHPMGKRASTAAAALPSASAPDAASGERLRPDQLLPTFFNTAHPAMILPAGKGPVPGDRVRLSHGLPDGDLAFTMPELRFHVHVQLEGRGHVFPMHLDQIGLVAGEGRVLFSFRCVFDYRTVPGERRFATVHEGPVPQAIPAGYTVALPAQ
jgi:hypothetical protein